MCFYKIIYTTNRLLCHLITTGTVERTNPTEVATVPQITHKTSEEIQIVEVVSRETTQAITGLLEEMSIQTKEAIARKEGALGQVQIAAIALHEISL